jgi:hypothetical protein
MTNEETQSVNSRSDLFMDAARELFNKDPRYRASLFSFYLLDERYVELLAPICNLKLNNKNWHPWFFR